MNIFSFPIRGFDNHGRGHYGAPRGSHTHQGIDLVCEAGTPIQSPIVGMITKIGWPYPDEERRHLRYVEITSNGWAFRVMYVTPLVELWQTVTTGDIICRSLMLKNIFPGITDHIHFEVIDSKGNRVDPTPVYYSSRSQIWDID